jgi:hypothetical protein
MGTIVRTVGLAFAAIVVGMIAWALKARQDAGDRLLPPAPDADEIDVVAIFAPLDYRSTAKAFRGGSIDVRFSGAQFDLRGATLDPAGAHLRVRVAFAGVSLVVPDSWHVVSRVDGFGGVGDSRPTADQPAAPGAPTLTIEGMVTGAGLGISSDLDLRQARWMRDRDVPELGGSAADGSEEPVAAGA